jgi:hypothetical protein
LPLTAVAPALANKVAAASAESADARAAFTPPSPARRPAPSPRLQWPAAPDQASPSNFTIGDLTEARHQSRSINGRFRSQLERHPGRPDRIAQLD